MQHKKQRRRGKKKRTSNSYGAAAKTGCELCIQACPQSCASLVVQGVKLGDMQATVQGFLSTGLFFVISNSTPLPFLSAQRPHPTIFSLYVFLSVLGQAAVHLALLVSFYFGALRLMPQV